MMQTEARKKLLAGPMLALVGLIIVGALALYGYGIYIAGVSNSTNDLLCSLVPVIGQVCLIWASWALYGAFFNAYTIPLFIWMALVIVFGNILRTSR
jgi:hypothetical protein